MTRTHQGRSFVVGFGIAAASLCGALTGGIWWFWATFSFDPVIAKELREEAAFGLGACAVALALLGTFCWYAYRAPVWSLAVVALSTAVLVAGCLDQLQDARSAPTGTFDVLSRSDAWLLAACPSSWPLLLLAAWGVARLLREPSSPAPR